MAKTTVKFNAGSFVYEDKTTKSNGGVTVNDNNQIQNINGVVTAGEVNMGNFDAFRNGDNLSFNLHPASISVAAQFSSLVEATVAAVEAQLNPPAGE